MPPIRHDVAAIVTSDWHLSELKPVARAESDWFDVQMRVLDEISSLQQKYYCPILIAGDLFDRWNASAWTINFALDNMPTDVYAIPGNHDLPFHSYKEIVKSAYWTLFRAGRIKNLPIETLNGIPTSYGVSLSVSPFPCGVPVEVRKGSSLGLNIALVHDYIWTEKTGHPGAPPSKRFGKWVKQLKGYDIAVFGDNHKGFLIQSDDKTSVINCGSLMRRKADEIGYKPCVGLIHANGKVTRHYLDTSKDKFSDIGKELAEVEATLKIDLSQFVEKLTEARSLGVDWKQLVRLYCDKNELDRETRKIIIAVVEGS